MVDQPFEHEGRLLHIEYRIDLALFAQAIEKKYALSDSQMAPVREQLAHLTEFIYSSWISPENAGIFKKLPTLAVVFFGDIDEVGASRDGVLGFCNPSEALEGKSVVYLDLPKRSKALASNLSKFREGLNETFLHESNHLKQFFEGNFARWAKAVSHIKERSGWLRIIDSTFRKRAHLSFLGDFLFLPEFIFVEGLQRFSREYQNISYDDKSFEATYRDGTLGARRLNIFVEEIENKLVMLKSHMIDAPHADPNLSIDDFTPYYNNLGYHMVYALFFRGNVRLDVLEGLSVPDFIRAYESTMISIGMQPVISLNSGSGMFDIAAANRRLKFSRDQSQQIKQVSRRSYTLTQVSDLIKMAIFLKGHLDNWGKNPNDYEEKSFEKELKTFKIDLLLMQEYFPSGRQEWQELLDGIALMDRLLADRLGMGEASQARDRLQGDVALLVCILRNLCNSLYQEYQRLSCKTCLHEPSSHQLFYRAIVCENEACGKPLPPLP